MIDNKALENKLTALKISGRIISVSENDFFTCYYVDFLPDVTLNKIKARRADLELFFKGSAVNIETDGGRVVLKVQKDARPKVSTIDFLANIPKDAGDIPVIIGENENGEKLYYDLCKMPHLLAGGSTGSGKSVFMHNVILSTMASYKASVVLIDVKRVEFSMYHDIPFLASDIIYNAHESLDILKRLCVVMDKRYNTLKENGARNIQEYRKKGGSMEYITIFIDELADLLLINNKIESYLVRIAQLGRAAGIHLVLATQRPDASILSGLIRTNIPSRVCFAVQKATDSRIILDQNGGENLRGSGDGLFIPIGTKNATRFQAPFIDTADLEKLVETIRHCNN